MGLKESLLEGGDLYAKLRKHSEALNSLQRRSKRKATDIVELQDRVDELEAENGELRLYMVAIIRLLVNKDVISREQLQKVADMIDLSDGESDGKFDGKIM
jgi:hypothetical protein